ncbi:MAG TPA: RNA polymerase sigma-70 factor, partial [Chitinophagaceae bacterium]|nr:RNA polymerase sigma-70 factor [Chitinophagaceae bacterium]
MLQESPDYNYLLERLKAADTEAFEALYVHSRERLFAYALYLIKDEIAAQDLVQELFIDLWERQLFRNIQTALIPYLTRTVHNRSLEYLKKEITKKNLKKQFEAIESDRFLETSRLENKELGKEIKAAIAKLPPMPAKVFQLHYIEKLSHAEIAERLNISRSTISNHMDRALKLLRADL